CQSYDSSGYGLF
nr:immunoglobulin light chain junction region [Macaca mulatta]MPO07339.1 immunoglobulin light chain junction region [Macaca mulatta]MPO07517.1 immunoglobulin light chain junction region [Macaca mulatta]MPO07994.1 immunoglobulin light chain junction region [Macaca mulatta]MPO08642.1 immunoglobulin light chain junction region [Macaca mulatta]